MHRPEAVENPDLRHDGFGIRWFADDPAHGRVEVLELAPLLATPQAERAIRAQADLLAGRRIPTMVPTFRIERAGHRLTVVSGAPESVSLADLLAALEFGILALPDAALVELAAAMIQAVAAMHEASGTAAHGALSPAHILLRRDGSVVLTGALFGESLEMLQQNREQLWRRFGLALPPSATLPRFDLRTDVTQLGANTVAIMLRRTLDAAEYPRHIIDLVGAATADTGSVPFGGSALRMWLQQTLQLQPRAMFGSAVEAARAFGHVGADAGSRRLGLQALQAGIRQLCGEPAAAPPVAAPRAPVRAVSAPAPQPVAAAAPRGFTLLRSVLPRLGLD